LAPLTRLTSADGGAYRGLLLLAFAVALGLRLVVAGSSYRVLVGDETGYRDTAVAIDSGRGHNLDGLLTFKGPLYPVMLAAVYRAAGLDNNSAVRVVQAAMGASVSLLVAWLGVLTLGRSTALVGAWIVAVYPVFVLLTELLISETLFTWLLMAALACAAWLLKAPSWRKAALVGAVCGLVALTRSIGIGLAVVLAAVHVVSGSRDITRARRLDQAAIVVLVCGFTITPWAVRNWVRLHAFVPVSTEFGRNLYSGWVSVPDEKIFGSSPDDETSRYALTIESEVARDRFLQQKAIAFIRAHPALIPRYVFLKSLYFWSPLDWDTMGHGEAIYNGAYVALAPFVLLGFWRASRQAPLALWVILPTVVYFWCVALAGSITPRYRYPIEPALVLLSAFGLMAYFTDAKNRLGRVAIAVPWVLCNLVAIEYSPAVKAAMRSVMVRAGIW
jgi:4-amino-4-deoxy-L-arabinose transferase-like glycosyltransferase